MADKRFAVLIDSDNVSAKYIESILSELTTYGICTYKRIYGDWTSTQNNKWREKLLEMSNKVIIINEAIEESLFTSERVKNELIEKTKDDFEDSEQYFETNFSK